MMITIFSTNGSTNDDEVSLSFNVDDFFFFPFDIPY
jgi:hypothetical protein